MRQTHVAGEKLFVDFAGRNAEVVDGLTGEIIPVQSPQLSDCIAALPEGHWKLDREETDAIREWAEVNYLPSDGIWRKDAVSPRRYLAIRIRPRQGELLRDGNRVRHFCIVTNRSDPDGGSGLDLIRWHRGKAGTIEHAHDVLMNELAGAALPSQKFGANAAWLRLNVSCTKEIARALAGAPRTHFALKRPALAGV
jgi:hypothetical protein